MASLSDIDAELGPFSPPQRAALKRIFTAVLPNLRFGHPKYEQPDPCVNFAAGFFHGTTAAVAGDTFTIPHGFGRAPYLAVAMLPLDVQGARTVDLTVAQVADAKRIYLTSSIEAAPISLYLEG